MATILEQYEAVATVSAKMLAAARAGDQDTLVQAQQRCASLIEEMRRLPEPRLDVDQQRRKLDLIRSILANDREIREIVEPWRAELGARLRNGKARRDLGKLYG